MEIRVLGTVELVAEGQVRVLPGAGERALLALLALAAGRVVPVSALVDALWGAALPANPGNALQVRVSKLRRALAAAGAPSELVVTRPPGYLLDIPRDRVDALRFTDQVAAARTAAHADPAAAARRYREALAAWHGPALAEFVDAAWAGPEAVRLTELQLAAREELVDLEVAAGRHSEVLGELEELTAAHPLRERLHARLMLALYRAGRQADALAAYQRARDLLDAELGLEPSSELRDLQEAILQQRADLAVPALATSSRAPEAAVSERVAPRLPARLTSFLGRDADLHRMGELLQTARLVTVTGPGGVGKTSLALEAARATAERFGDGVGFVRLAGVTDPVRCPRRRWPRWRSGTWRRRPPRTSCSVTCATAACCWFWTIASTSPTPVRYWPSIFWRPVPASGCWRPAASRWPPAARSSTPSTRCRSRRQPPAPPS